jgi:hypothetical protein
LVVAVAFLHLSCGGPAEDGESRESALGGFGSWIEMPPKARTTDAPALAKVGTAPMTAFGLGVGQDSGSIVWAPQGSGGSWTAMTMIKSGGPFLERPAVAGLTLATGGRSTDHFAIVARRADDRGYYIRIQDRTGRNVVQDWARVGTGIYASGPAVAFVPPGPLTGPQGRLVVIGRGLDDRIYENRNTLTANQAYSHSWAGPDLPFPEQRFDAVSAPAIAYACPHGSGDPSRVASARTQLGNYLMSTYTSTGWSAWTSMNGSFESGPAIGVGCNSTTSEISVYGRHVDNRIWAGVYTPGVSSGFVPIGFTKFVGSPTAAGFNNQITIAANGATGSQPTVPFVTTAQSPAPSPTMPPSQGLVLWVKGDVGLNSSNGQMTSWLDQAGQNQHIDQVLDFGVKPSTGLDTIDGVPCVTFPHDDLTAHAYHAGAMKDRNGNMLPNTQARTVMAVIKPKLGGDNNSAVGGAVFSMADAPSFECLFDVEAWGGHLNGWFIFDNIWPFGGSQLLAPDTSAATWKDVPVLGEWRSSGLPAIAFAVNGGSDQPLTDADGNPTTVQKATGSGMPGASFMIGNAWFNQGNPHVRNFHGAIAEILVWDYDLASSPTARAAAIAYIAARYPSIAGVP